ncbi:MAG: acetolactate synthase small subunit [Candidatus Diapherotrites archaeon]|uniref:Acetolactate synthase small subunit n=1 Tax=Candidatus Iainarchaeum sp. TaxID=3101447 RepID=A0A939C5A0_9ARCH|nr:acetolactate synthase small subunit [Candidatus Diapherotrites archaeon]
MIEAKKKSESEHKHIVGILVEDQPGVLTKLSGLFARRGFNIDTIIVGKTAIPLVSHIVISLYGGDRTLEQLEKQLNKLVDVVKIIDLNPERSVVREHCLVKVASSAKMREDLVNISKLHKANALDLGKDSMVIEIVGKPEKIDNFLSLMKKYGIKEVSRTGINAMQRASNGK